MSTTQRTTLLVVGMICVTIVLIVALNVLNRPPINPTKDFIEACAWGSERTRTHCAELYLNSTRP